MRTTLSLALACVPVFLGLAGCASDNDANAGRSDQEQTAGLTLPWGAAPVAEHKRYTITVRGATISPQKATGLPWDGPPFAQEAISFIRQVFQGADPQTRLAVNLLALLARQLIGATQPPDVRGSAVLVWAAVGSTAGGSVTEALHERDDTYLPTWGDRPHFVDVDLDERAHGMLIHLEDVDEGEVWGLDTNDDIGNVSIDAFDFQKALAAGGTLQIPVGDQEAGQIPYVEITVRAQ